jgi:hypothetical protein
VKPRSGDVAGANLNQGRRAGSVQPSEVEPDPDLALNANKRAVESTCSFRVSRNDQSRRRRGESHPPPRLIESSSDSQPQWLPDRYEAYISNTSTTLMLWHHGVSVRTQNWRQTSTDFVPQALPLPNSLVIMLLWDLSLWRRKRKN